MCWLYFCKSKISFTFSYRHYFVICVFLIHYTQQLSLVHMINILRLQQYLNEIVLVCLLLSLAGSQNVCDDCEQEDYLHMDIEDRVYLVIGESQKGKSSFIKDITGQDVPIGEYGDGKSFTSEINLYKSVKFLKGATFIDTFGAQRTDLSETKGFQSALEQYLISGNFGESISGIILIESYMSEASSITPQVELISRIFGKFMPQSIAILMTKRNMIADQGYSNRRRAVIEEDARRLGILSDIIDIQTSYSVLPSISYEQQQVNSIAAILNDLQPIPLKYMQERINFIEKRSQELQLQGKKMHNIKKSCLTGDGHGLAIFNGKKHLDEVVAYFEEYPSIELCRRQAEQQFASKIKKSLFNK